MRVCDVPDRSVRSLDDKTLLALSRHWGKVGQVAFRRFLATLPEIARRGLYRRARCHSIEEYASKYSNASREVVDTVFLVYRRVGAFDVLWDLFAEGKTGLTVFRRISRHVTAESAAWWAHVIQTCTLKEIERLLEELPGEDSVARGQLSFSPAACSAASSRSAAPSSTPARDGAADLAASPDAGAKVGGAPHETAGSRALEAIHEGASQDGQADDEPVRGTDSPGGGPAPGSAVGSSARDRAEQAGQETGDQTGREAGPEARAQPGKTAGPEAARETDRTTGPTVAQPEQPRGDRLAADPARLRWLTPLASRIAEHLVAEYRRRGFTVSTAEVVEAALKYLAIEGLLPPIGTYDPARRDGQGGDRDGGPDASREPAATEGPDRHVMPCGGPAGGPAAGPDRDLAAGRSEDLACGPAEDPAAGRDKDLAAGPDGDRMGSRAGQYALPAEPLRTRLPRVLISLSEVGITFLRTIGGLIPLSPGQAEFFESGRPAIAFADLLARANEAGESAAGRAIPAAVKLAIWIRAGGRCEAKGCGNVLEEFAHLDPYSESPMHRPDQMAGLCSTCHRAPHDGLIANPEDPPGDWRHLAVSSPRTSSAVDRKVQACRQAARSAVLLPPTVG